MSTTNQQSFKRPSRGKDVASAEDAPSRKTNERNMWFSGPPTEGCRRCCSLDHKLGNCTVPCTNCRRVDSWCDQSRCTAKCHKCEGNHMARQCQQCSKCAEYGHKETDCVNSRVECLRCESTTHQLKECPNKCIECGNIRSWCKKNQCVARCTMCDGRHITEKCDKFRMEMRGCQYVKVELHQSQPIKIENTILNQENFPYLR